MGPVVSLPDGHTIPGPEMCRGPHTFLPYLNQMPSLAMNTY